MPILMSVWVFPTVSYLLIFFLVHALVLCMWAVQLGVHVCTAASN